MSILESLAVIDWIRIGVALLSFISASIYFRYYFKTQIFDYLLYTGMWLTLIIQQFADVIRINLSSPIVLVQQYADSGFMLFFFFIFIYAMRMKWDHPPRILWYFGVLWFFVGLFLITFFEVVDLPERGIVFFVEMRKYVDFSPPDVGVGFITEGNVILMASGFQLVSECFRFFVLSLFIYVYLSTKYVIIDNRVRIARNLWIVAASLGCMRPILILGHNFSLWTTDPLFPNLFNLIGLAVIAYTTIRYPEAILLSKVQLIRALSLYQSIQALQTHEQVQEFGLVSIVEYLRKLPPEIIAGFEIE